jgi:hypothetical protein
MALIRCTQQSVVGTLKRRYAPGSARGHGDAAKAKLLRIAFIVVSGLYLYVVIFKKREGSPQHAQGLGGFASAILGALPPVRDFCACAAMRARELELRLKVFVTPPALPSSGSPPSDSGYQHSSTARHGTAFSKAEHDVRK